jgi:hypothetical protein
MRTAKVERARAEQVSAAVDQLIRDPGAPVEETAPRDMALLDTARQLARLPSLLGPVPSSLEQRVLPPTQARASRTAPVRRVRLGWAAAGLVAIALIVMSFTPLGHTAVASFRAIFHLGRTEVRITPADVTSLPMSTEVVRDTATHGAAIQQSLTLEEAQSQVAFDIPEPAYMPPGFRLQEAIGHTYPELPAWVPQPFLLELVYRDDSARECSLRLYPITLGEKASISRMNLEASPIQDVQDVDINGQPGVLLRVGTTTVWQEVVWEQGDLILALSAPDLSQAELLRIARSIH